MLRSADGPMVIGECLGGDIGEDGEPWLFPGLWPWGGGEDGSLSCSGFVSRNTCGAGLGLRRCGSCLWRLAILLRPCVSL